MAETELKTRIILRNDSDTNWTAAKSTILLKGEVGIEFNTTTNKTRIKIGDGTKTWEQLSYFGGDEAAVYQGATCNYGATSETKIASINAVVPAGTTLNKGDIGIAKVYIRSDNTGSELEYTSYVYNGTEWTAMDGNYSAENVYFAADLTYTASIGVLPAPSGSATLAARGKNVKEVLASILAKRVQPTKTEPIVTLSGAQSGGNVELGTTVTKSGTLTSTLSAGSYTYGPATGVTASAWSGEIKYTQGKSESIATVSSASTYYEYSFVMGEDGNTVAVNFANTATHNAGTVAVDNLGDASSPTIQIAAGTKSKNTTATYTGVYNSYYYGELNTVQAASYFDDVANAHDIVRTAAASHRFIGQPSTVTMHSSYKTLYFISIDGKKVTKLFNNTTFDDWTSQLSAVSTITIGCADSTDTSKGNYVKTYNIQLLTLPDGAAKDYSLTVTLGNE